MDLTISNSLSGLMAARQRLGVAASNVANAGSDGALPGSGAPPGSPQPYAPLRVDQRSLLSGGTQAVVSQVDPASVTGYDPDAPYANAEGEVAVPNVDLASEAIGAMTARRAYEANAKMIAVADDIDRMAIDIGSPRHDLRA